MTSYKIFIDEIGGMSLEAGDTFDSINKLSKQISEKYHPYKVRKETFPMVPNCWAFFVNPN